VASTLNKPYEFAVSLRFEPFYALNVLLDTRARIHKAWRTETLDRLPASFHSTVQAIGAASEIWAALPSVLPQSFVSPSFGELVGALRALPIKRFQDQLLSGVLHSPAIVSSLLRKDMTLRRALGKIPRAKREWLGFVGLYPYDAAAPFILALEALLDDPESFRGTLLELLEAFWHTAFAATWDRLAPQLQSSRAEKERLFATCSLSEFMERALIRATVDEERGVIAAVRGGYELELAKLHGIYFFPSAFNDRRYWSALGEHAPPLVAFFPYFDPAISLSERVTPSTAAALARPDIDPALIFKALGDSTRFAIATLLADAPRTSIELARALAISKPTVSHHVSVMRQAGLLRETYESGSVRLALDRSVLEDLSALTLAKLYAKRNRS
jgi:DNA-binding transcriptional ArsR family regulator